MGKFYCVLADEKIMKILVEILQQNMETKYRRIGVSSHENSETNLRKQITYLYKILVLYNYFLDGWNVELKCGKIRLVANKNKLNNASYISPTEGFNLSGFIRETGLVDE